MSGPAARHGERRAALALHAVAPADRRWLLERLDGAQRERLQALLTELDSLGIRFDPADMEALAGDPGRRAGESTNWAAQLRDEPSWVIDALTTGRGTFAPAAQAALRAAAADRARGAAPHGDEQVPSAVAPQRRWLDGVRQWLR